MAVADPMNTEVGPTIRVVSDMLHRFPAHRAIYFGFQDSSLPSFCESLDIIKAATNGIINEAAGCYITHALPLSGLYQPLYALNKRALHPDRYPPVAIR